MDVLLVLHHPWSMRNEKTGAQHFDVSLLLTESNITFSERIRPICLPSGPPDSRKYCWFAGWGRVLTNPVLYAEQLQDSRLKINQYCGPYSFVLTRNTFCAGFQGTSSGCVGDSGGPLVCADQSGENFSIFGVGSWSTAGCHPENPTGFVKVYTPEILQWIQTVIY